MPTPTHNERQRAESARQFALRWSHRGSERAESQPFWLDLLRTLGVEQPEAFIRFEEQVKLDHTSFIDGHIDATRVLIEQKSRDKDLRKPIRQSDGSLLTPFQQAKRYSAELPYSQRPRWIVTCNFTHFLIHDMERPGDEPQEVALSDLGRDYRRLLFLVDTGSEHIRREMEVSLQAGEIVGRLYDALRRQYIDPDDPDTLHSLNVLCVRLVFCLYAEDAGVFGRPDMFHDYLAPYSTEDTRNALMRLFEVLDTPPERRDPYLKASLAAFPYTNGGLFARRDVVVPQMTDEIRHLLLQHASLDFDWSQISPTIFGAVFESTLNPETRRAAGMHYTSIENIHKVIDPLFLDDLRQELAAIESLPPGGKAQMARLKAFRQRLADIVVLDPACGSGNFLTESYLSLRRLENRAILLQSGGVGVLDWNTVIHVRLEQFRGIEVNDFAVAVATTALWISEAQMMAETERITGREMSILPLKSYATIVEGNALRTDWRPFLRPATEGATTGHAYIIGNPPFVGARLMNADQKADLLAVGGPKWKNLGNMDYVCGWYLKAAEVMAERPDVRTALVSTNSITQGEQVANLWQPLTEQYGVEIDFAYRTFRWDSEATHGKAHVHCVIVGFGVGHRAAPCRLYTGSAEPLRADHINAYLMAAPDVFVGSRQQPLCPMPPIGIGNKPIDGGNYLFTTAERDAFVAAEPQASALFRPWYGAEEFIHRRPRWCLWLGDCSPAQLRAMPHCYERVQAVRAFRLASKSEPTRRLADRPTRFHVENMPEGHYIIIPSVSSERRRYVPMGFLGSESLSSNLVLIIPNAELWHFAVLESNVHMAWMRAVGGRLKSDYRYSKDVVYNNFPWPSVLLGDDVRAAQCRERLTETARAILDARDAYLDSTLADLYDDTTMPPDLRRAHADNDRAVLDCYGWPVRGLTEPDCVARLFSLYSRLL